MAELAFALLTVFADEISGRWLGFVDKLGVFGGSKYVCEDYAAVGQWRLHERAFTIPALRKAPKRMVLWDIPQL